MKLLLLLALSSFAQDPARDAMALMDLTLRKGCYSDPATHRARTCALALGGNQPKHYVSLSFGYDPRAHREGPVSMTVLREDPKFLAGYDAEHGYEVWGNESVQVETDSDGELIRASKTTPMLCKAELACPGAALEPRTVKGADGVQRRVLIGRVDVPLGKDAPAVAELLKRTRAAAFAKYGP